MSAKIPNVENTYIYIIEHPKFLGWIKVGKTTDLSQRLGGYNVGCPFRQYRYSYHKITTDFNATIIEKHFAYNIKNNCFEWFNIETLEAIDIINEILNSDNIANYILNKKKSKWIKRYKINNEYIYKIQLEIDNINISIRYLDNVVYKTIIDMANERISILKQRAAKYQQKHKNIFKNEPIRKLQAFLNR